MILYDKIAKWGYEVEYPLRHSGYDTIDEITNVDAVAYDRWNLHYDGGGVEFTVVRPTKSRDGMEQEIRRIYAFIDSLLQNDDDDNDSEFYIDDDYFNGDDAGVHIRIDVTDWTTQERLRFMRLFSSEFDKQDRYNGYIDWMSSNVFGRDWRNWNNPFPYSSQWTYVNKGQSTETKSYNVQYENDYQCSGRNTIEIRGFGVNRDVSDAIDQLNKVKVLCDIVDTSLLLGGGNSVADKLYFAWDVVVNGKDITTWVEEPIGE